MSKILLLSSDSSLWGKVEGVLRAAGYEPELGSDANAAEKSLRELAHDLIVLDLSFDAENGGSIMPRIASSYWVRCIYVSSLTESENIRLLRANPNMSVLLGRNSPVLERDIAAASHKLLSKKIWGLVPYVSGDNPVSMQEIRSYAQKEQYMDFAQSYSERLGAFPGLADMVRSVASELIMNAIFDAPVDRKTGKHPYAHIPRTQAVELASSERIVMKITHDEHQLAISVADSYGSLRRDGVVNSLFRCQRKGEDQLRLTEGGTGVGLYMTLNSVSQLIFNVKPGARTETICIFQLTKKRREFEERIRSLCFFTEEE